MLGFEGLYMLTGVMSVICLIMYFAMYGSRKQNYADKEEITEEFHANAKIAIDEK